MPTTYAHYRLGDAVIQKLPDSIKKTVLNHRQLFDIGVHGPDIFFYHSPIIKNDIVKLGQRMHEEAGAVFFARVPSVVHKSQNKEAHKAFLYGFLCHFAMDVTCHGYIDEQIEKTGVGHYEIEAEYDRALLEADGYEAISKCLTEHLHATKENADVIADFFEEVSSKQVKQTLKRMIFFLNVLRAPSPVKRYFLFALLKLAGVYESMHGLVINYKENPACKETTRWLAEHFDEAVNIAVSLICEYEEYLEKGGKLSDTFAYNFSTVKVISYGKMGETDEEI